MREIGPIVLTLNMIDFDHVFKF